MVLKVHLKRGGIDIDFGIFGDRNAPEKNTVAFIVFSKERHRTSFCSVCIGGKKNTRKYVYQCMMYCSGP